MTQPKTAKQLSKFTPGPWYADIRSGVAVVASKPTPNCLDGGVEGELARFQGQYHEEPPYWTLEPGQQANARLIAAAPEMYELLSELIDWSEALGHDALQRPHFVITARRIKAAIDGEG